MNTYWVYYDDLNKLGKLLKAIWNQRILASLSLRLKSHVLLNMWFVWWFFKRYWTLKHTSWCYYTIISIYCYFNTWGIRLLTRHHQSYRIGISFCKDWHIHPRKAKVIISGYGGWNKSIPLSPMAEMGSLFVITQSDSYATFQRLQGMVICLPGGAWPWQASWWLGMGVVSKPPKVVVLLSVSDDRWLVTPPAGWITS